MSSYHTSFSYLNKNSYDDFNLQIVHFAGGDAGEVDSYLSQEAIYTDSPRGTKRTMYGTKYNSVALLNITVMKPNGEEFGIEKTRQINKWLTGSNQYSWMDLYIGDKVKYRMHCFVQDVRPYKIDSRIVGFVVTVESSSPWCYSTLQQESYTIQGSKDIQIDNLSDDMNTFVNLRTVFENTNGKSLIIDNKTIGDTTEIYNLVANEIITLSDNMFITSDNTTRIFGKDFNYTWPRLKAGINNFTISGTGTIVFEYIFPMKVVDCVRDLNAASDPICSEDGTIILDTLDWGRISNTPSTLQGYGITDCYTIREIDEMLGDVTVDNVYTKPEVDDKISILEAQISDLLYKEISITSFSNNVGAIEKGSIVYSVTLSWKVNKTPTSLKLSGESIDTSLRTYTYNNLSLKSDKTWTISATDERNATSSKSTSVTFLNGVYYGVSAIPQAYDSDFVLSLNKQLSSAKVSSFSATSGEGQYVYYCLPTSMGTCSFNVGGFTGGFTLVDTIEFVNKYNYSEMYYIYRSDNPNLGTKTVLVS